nr:hypothetical protein BaRGS_028804 [Batillaria attramentaria]
MENLQLRPSEDREGNGVPQETRHILWSMLEREDECVTEALERLQAEQHEICALLQEMDGSQLEKTDQC